MNPRHFLGVDGGNSKTIAIVAREDGTVAGIARGAGSDMYGRETPEIAFEEMSRVIAEALASAGITVGQLERAALSLAGADWPEDFARLQRELSARVGPELRPVIVNDALGALRSGALNWEGIAVACGTFNAIGARNRDGRVFHFGAWPDRVGGYDLGRQALDAVYRAGLGLGPQTSLTPKALELYAMADAGALMHAFTRLEGRIPPRSVQRMSPVVLAEADAGDAVSRAIVAAGGRILGQQARASAARVGLPVEGTTIVLTGGVFDHPSELLSSAIMRELEGAMPVRPAVPPVAGALGIAFDAAQHKPDWTALTKNVIRAMQHSLLARDDP
jgi:N-acetylglucosamine kinase-like BadF-type ATPase